MAIDQVHVWVHDERPMHRVHDSAARFVDAPLPTSVAARGAQNGPATRTKVCEFPGSSFVAERSEGGGLIIYHVASGAGLPTETIGDARRTPMDAAKMQLLIDERRRVVGGR